MNPKATLTSKGQITIPLAIRQALGLVAGIQLSFDLTDGELRVRPVGQKTWADLWSIAAGAPLPPNPVDVGAAIQAALDDYKSGPADFADYLALHQARALGASKLLTFDRKLAKASGAERLM